MNDSAIVAKHFELFPNYVFTDVETSLDLMAAEIHTLRMERGEVATQTVGISGASAAMRVGGMPRWDQHLPDATSPMIVDDLKIALAQVRKDLEQRNLEFRRISDDLETAQASESQLARMAGEYERLYREILGPMLTRCRIAQDSEHGGPKHDDTHTPAEWAEFIRKFAGRAEYQGQYQDNAEAVARYQAAMIDVAGLAISAVLSSQRKVRGELA